MTVYRAASNFPQLTCPALGYSDGLSDQRQHETWRAIQRQAIASQLVLSPLAAVTQLHAGPVAISVDEPFASGHGHIGAVENVRDDLADRRAARDSGMRDSRSLADFYPRGA